MRNYWAGCGTSLNESMTTERDAKQQLFLGIAEGIHVKCTPASRYISKESQETKTVQSQLSSVQPFLLV